MLPTTTTMRLLTLLTILGYLISVGCHSTQEYQKPDDALEAGREFIRFALDGDMRKAKQFILPDNGTNERLFENIEKKYTAETAEEKEKYRTASIIVNTFKSINDSTAIINFSNSFKKQDSEIKLVKSNGEWWVDFKYTFTGEGDFNEQEN